MTLGLEENQKIIELIFDCLSIQIAVVDHAGVIVLINEAWRRDAGDDAKIGGNYLCACDHAAAAGIRSVLDGSSARFELEYPTQRGLEQRWFQMVVLPLSPRSDDKHVMISHQEITRSRAAETSLAQRLTALEHRRVDSSRLAQLTTRELQTPLRALRNLVHWMEEDLGPSVVPAIGEHLGHMRARIAVMSKMVSNLLRYAQADSAHAPPVDVDVRTLIDSLVRTMERPSNIAIEVDAPMPSLRASRASLRLVFFELINNAITHHDQETGVVRVRAQPKGLHWEFCIEDDGPGIPPGEAQKTLLLFETLDPHLASGPSGIGLPLARRIVEDHGGNLHIVPRAGRGTTVCFTWPLTLPG